MDNSTAFFNSSLRYDSMNSFGPAESHEFDFTPLFEDVMLSILPSALLILLLPFRIFALHRKPRKVKKSSLHGNKLLFLMVFATMQTVLLILHSLYPKLRNRATVAAATLSFIDALGLCALSHIEHIHSVRPSAIINVYLLITLPFDMARCRTLWMDGATASLAAVFSSALGVKVLILIAEAIEKRDILLSRYRNSSPEVTSGIYSRSFFFWLNSLMTTGFSRVISNEDLYPIDDEMTSIVLHERAQKIWKATNTTHPRALFWATIKTARTSLAYCIFPRMCLIGFRYAQPFLLERTVGFANSPEEPDSIGWGLTVAFGLVFTGLAIATGSYYHMTYRFVTSVRGILISQIYSKTVDLSITALNESVAVTLMASDTATICLGFTNLHELWAVPIELGLALWLLERQLGLAFLAPAAVALFSTLTILVMAKYIGNAQKIWIQGIQTRVDVTASMLGSMKGVKMLGFTDNISKIIQGLRVTELKLSELFRKLLFVRVAVANSTGTIAPLLTFVIFVIAANASGRTLDTANAFTALSLISLLTSPMNTLIRTIPMLNASMACFARIQSFLNSDARKDHRLPLNGVDSLEEVTTATDIELQTLPSFGNSNSKIPIMVAQHATFGWESEDAPAVSDITFTLMRHQFCFVIGPVGSGKSTLLKGLLGETPSSQGFVYSDSPTIAFVDQTPWIQNGSIKQNILGISNYDEPWYDQVVRACALEFDIAKLPKGHLTPVGSAGISLSGGQKQRVALARAVYSKKELVVLDDVFSGLDAETEEQVFSRLLGANGLFRQRGTTVLLVTHAVHRLPYSQYIISLDHTGHISEQGSFEALKDSGGYVTSLATNHKQEDESSSDSEASVPTIDKAALVAEAEDTQVEMEELNRQTGDIAVYKYYFASIGWKQNTLFTLHIILFGVGTKLTEFLLTYWTSAVKREGNKVNGLYLGLYAMLACCGMIGMAGAAGHLLLRMVPLSAEKLHERLLNTVMGAPLSFFTSTDTGTTTNRFSQDMTVIDSELPYSFVDLTLSLILAIMGAVLMCLSAGYFAATMPVVILAVWVLQKYYLRTSRQMRLLDLEAKSPLYSHFIESLTGLVTLRAFDWAENFQERNLRLLDNSQKPYYLLFCIQRWLALILDLLVAALAVILMVLVVKLRSDISGGFVGLALLNVMSFNENLATIIKEWTNLETSFGAVARLMSFSATTVSENLPEETQTVPENWPDKGAVEFKNVSASYTPSSNLVIRNLNMTISPGEKIGICGRSGSGKSSLIISLFRMLELAPGSSITIDGIDISTLPRQLVRSRLNAIPQEPFFVKGTIRSNADPYSVHTDAAIINAIQKVHLWSLVQAKGGLDSQLEADFFSHGQRQLFCLARAILRKSKVVVLDEVTSSVDKVSDALMQKIIRGEFEGCTIIAVAHRLDTILDFDRIALLGGGRLVEMDTPERLLGRESAFKELFNS